MAARSETLKIFGAPGCGKTTTLLNLMEEEMSAGVHPDRMAYLTFTRRARKEAVDRVKARFSVDDLPYFRTLHSIAYRELGAISSGIIRDSELEEFGELVGETFSPQRDYGNNDGIPLVSGGHRGDRLLAFDHLRRQRLETIDRAYHRWGRTQDFRVVERFCRAYKRWKEMEVLLDFTDLLERVADPLPVDVVFVDEAQDLSLQQWRTLATFAKEAKRIYIAGDDDQAIFIWAGADPDALIDHPGNVKVLDRSYRLSQAIFDLSQRIVRRISRRQDKRIKPRGEPGLIEQANSFDHIDVDPTEDTLILYRNHYLSENVEARLIQEGVPFSRSGGRPSPGYQWGPAIFYWERLRKGKTLTGKQLRETTDAMVVGGRTLKRGGRARVRHLSGGVHNLTTLINKNVVNDSKLPWFEALDRLPDTEIEYLRRIIKHHGSRALVNEPKVRLSTIHAAKGAEADRVVLLTDISPKVREGLHEDPDDELRVFYVGVTRARDRLTLVGSGGNPIFDRIDL